MKNILFDKKFLGQQQNSYKSGWNKAWENYKKVLEEDLEHYAKFKFKHKVYLPKKVQA